MTLQELASVTTIQGNIRISVWKDGKETGSRYLTNVDYFDHWCHDCDDIEDYEVNYMYAKHEFGVTCLEIELEQAED